jgi:hypothetical protein
MSPRPAKILAWGRNSSTCHGVHHHQLPASTELLAIEMSLYEYPVEPSRLNLGEQQYQDIKTQWTSVLERFDDALRAVSSEGKDSALDRHQRRGQLLRTQPVLSRSVAAQLTSLTARDRISLLLDQDSPFLELCPFAGYGNENSTPSANLIAGIGVVRYARALSTSPSHPGAFANTRFRPVGKPACSCRTFPRKAAELGTR